MWSRGLILFLLVLVFMMLQLVFVICETACQKSEERKKALHRTRERSVFQVIILSRLEAIKMERCDTNMSRVRRGRDLVWNADIFRRTLVHSNASAPRSDELLSMSSTSIMCTHVLFLYTRYIEDRYCNEVSGSILKDLRRNTKASGEFHSPNWLT